MHASVTPAFLLGTILLLAMPAIVSAKPAYVPGPVNLRSAAGTSNTIVTKIPGGSLIDAGECKDGWCAVTWQDKSGFAIQTALDLSGSVPQRRRTVHPRRRSYEDEGPPEPPPYSGPPPCCCERSWGWGWGWRW